MGSTQPVVDGDRRIYLNRRRQLLIGGSILGIYLATLSQIFEPDPTTGMKPLPGDYLWVVIPGTIALFVLLWRTMKSRVESDERGVTMIRAAGRERVPWTDVRGFEVHPSPSRAGFAVRLRRRDESLITVRNEINLRPLRDRDEARRRARPRAVAFCDQLEADRRSRLATGDSTPAPAAF